MNILKLLGIQVDSFFKKVTWLYAIKVEEFTHPLIQQFYLFLGINYSKEICAKQCMFSVVFLEIN